MTAFVGGLGFVMMMIGAAGGCNEDWPALLTCLGICIAGVGLMYAADRMEKRRKRR